MLLHNQNKKRLSYVQSNNHLTFLSLDDIKNKQDTEMQGAFYFLLSKFAKENQKYEYGYQILLGNKMKRLIASPKKETVEQGSNLAIQWELFPIGQPYQPY